MDESLSVSRSVAAPAETVFAVLTDPFAHGAIDGTGWVAEPLDDERIAAAGQVFGMGMYHPNHPDGHYRMHNRVEVFDAPRAISWRPGQYGAGGDLEFGGWTWRHDVEPTGDASCTVTLTYDWSAVPASIREYISFPPVGEEHYTRSLDNLARLAENADAARSGDAPGGDG